MTYVRGANEPDPTIEGNRQISESASMFGLTTNHPADVAARREHAQQQTEPEYTAPLPDLRNASRNHQQATEVDVAKAKQLLAQEDALNAAITAAATTSGLPINEWSISAEHLRSRAVLNEKLDRTARELGMPGVNLYDRDAGLTPPGVQNQPQAQPQVQNQHPATFPDGSTVQVAQNEDGTIEAKLITGEVFKGDPITVTRKLSEAQVNTKRYAQDWRQKYETVTKQPTQPVQPQLTAGNGNGNGNQAIQPTEVLSPTAPLTQALAGEVIEEAARQLGYASKAEMIQGETEKGQLLSDFKNTMTASDFLTRHPDYPNTPQAASALEQIMDNVGLEMGNLEHMSAGYMLGVRSGLIHPLTPEEIAVSHGGAVRSSRPAPPPSPPAGATVNADPRYANGFDPWSVPTDELRKAILQGYAAEGRTGPLEASSAIIPAQRGWTRP